MPSPHSLTIYDQRCSQVSVSQLDQEGLCHKIATRFRGLSVHMAARSLYLIQHQFCGPRERFNEIKYIFVEVQSCTHNVALSFDHSVFCYHSGTRCTPLTMMAPPMIIYSTLFTINQGSKQQIKTTRQDIIAVTKHKHRYNHDNSNKCLKQLRMNSIP